MLPPPRFLEVDQEAVPKEIPIERGQPHDILFSFALLCVPQRILRLETWTSRQIFSGKIKSKQLEVLHTEGSKLKEKQTSDAKEFFVVGFFFLFFF